MEIIDNLEPLPHEDRNYMNIKKEDCYIAKENETCLRIGDMAPPFCVETTLGNCKLEDFKGRWLCLFSSPADFTPVCSTELISFSKMEPEFKKRNCCLLGHSVDSIHSHLAWLHSLNKIMGVPVPFPLIADSSMEVAKKYGMIAPNVSSTKTIRCVYIICPEGKIRAILNYPDTTGRNISEILRLIDALQFSDTENLLTPANWTPGMPAVVKPPMCYQEVMERVNNPGDLSYYDFYMCFKPNPNMQMPMMQNAMCCPKLNETTNCFNNNCNC